MSTQIKCVGCSLWYDIQIMEEASILGTSGLACSICIDEYIEGTMTGMNKSSVTVPTVSKCLHHLTPFNFEEYTVYLTGSSASSSRAQAEWPTAGVYLDEGWLDGQIASTDGTPMTETENWPSLYIGWPDRGVIDLKVLTAATEWAWSKVTEGGRLEIACIGGHGRTGTFATALMIWSGWDALRAFNHLRKEYCEKAVESREQLELLAKFAKGL